MRSERRTDAGPEGRGSDFQFHHCETLCEPRGELKPRSRWSGIRTSPIKGDGRIRTELAPLGRGDQALLGSTFVRPLLFLLLFFYALVHFVKLKNRPFTLCFNISDFIPIYRNNYFW